MKHNYEFIQGHKVNLKAWTRDVTFDQNAKDQLLNLSKMPFIFKHIAIMPDVHLGKGCSIGTVLPTKGAIIPAAVGVDLSCGMLAAKLSLKAKDLPDNLHKIRCDMEAVVPHGRTDNGGANDVGGWKKNPPLAVIDAWAQLAPRYEKIVDKHPKIKAYNTIDHLGTLGTGNHFVELCIDESDDVWVMLHSGSRGVGNKIGMYFIEKAKEEMLKYHIADHLPDQDLSYLVEHTSLYDDYIEALEWASDYAKISRETMLEAILKVLSVHLKPFSIVDEVVNCHHNYVTKENHFGENILITRKGAVSARLDQKGIIPGSMGTASYIVRGLGNKESFCSCSHGAGRVMSRGEAKKRISMEEHAKAMTGIEARLDADVLDESPSAYKPIEKTMLAQDDLVEILHTLRQVLNIKG
jgi:tRNA-splicing ligase RtcB